MQNLKKSRLGAKSGISYTLFAMILLVYGSFFPVLRIQIRDMLITFLLQYWQQYLGTRNIIKTQTNQVTSGHTRLLFTLHNER